MNRAKGEKFLFTTWLSGKNGKIWCGAFLFTISLLIAAERTKSSLQSSKECGKCHRDIYEVWKESLHALSHSDPIYQASYQKTYTNTKGEARKICNPCHAPASLVNSDYDVELPLTQEGILCDFCHSVKSIELKKGLNRITLDLGDTKRGPISFPKQYGSLRKYPHGVEYSPLFTDALFCASCHEFVNDAGVKVLSTYSEWKDSPYVKKGITCQKCHMPLIEGKIVITAEERVGKVNLHKISGGSSLEQLQKAVQVEITDTRWEKEGLWIGVTVTNVGAGHKVPTGLPLKKLTLKVRVTLPGEVAREQERAYSLSFTDLSGKPVEDIGKLMDPTSSVSLAGDNRISPEETREEIFLFPVPEKRGVKVEAFIQYEFNVMLLEPRYIRIKIAETSAEVK